MSRTKLNPSEEPRVRRAIAWEVKHGRTRFNGLFADMQIISSDGVCVEFFVTAQTTKLEIQKAIHEARNHSDVVSWFASEVPEEWLRHG